VCPGNTGILFEENVQLGLRVYNLKREISQTEDEIRDFQKKLDNKNLDRETSRDLHAKLRHRDEALTRLRVLLIEAQSIPVIR
jgi:predicted RNase H-like nuclease (RuvC/YqgF family)